MYNVNMRMCFLSVLGKHRMSHSNGRMGYKVERRSRLMKFHYKITWTYYCFVY